MHALHQQVGGDEDVLVLAVFQYCAVIAHPVLGFGVLQFDALGQSLDESKLTDCCYFCCHLFCFVYVVLNCLVKIFFSLDKLHLDGDDLHVVEPV